VRWSPGRASEVCAARVAPPECPDIPSEEVAADGTGWRNASFGECLPSTGAHGLDDVTETAGYGWRFFLDTARSRSRRTLLPMFTAMTTGVRAAGRPPPLRLAYFNLLFRNR